MERDFLTSENTFLIYFSDISDSDLCRYQTFIPVSFSSSGNVVLKRILHSGQWKQIFLLVETILFQHLKYLFHQKQFFHLLEINFKQILFYSQPQRIFCLVETIFFHSDFFRNHYCDLRKANIFFKNLIFTRGNCFIQFVFQKLTQMEVAFGPVKSHFPRNPSFWLVETDFFSFFFLLSFAKVLHSFLFQLYKYLQGPAEDGCLIIRPFSASIYIYNTTYL